MQEFNDNFVPDRLSRPQWLEEIEKEIGRPIRILNLGNIANNGFQNAKIMRRAGIDADCVAYDYYHVMGTAEWEDADFSGDIGDSFYPDWWRVKMRNYRRPKWFIQGPKRLCLEYLRARHDKIYKHKHNLDENKIWEKLSYATQKQNYKQSSLSRFTLHPVKFVIRSRRVFAFWRYNVKILYTFPHIRNAEIRSRTEKYWPLLRGIGAVLALPFFFLTLSFSIVSERTIKFLAVMTPEGRLNYSELRKAKRKVLIRTMKTRLYPISYWVLGIAASWTRSITGKRFGEIFSDELADRIGEFVGIRSTHATYITVNMDVREIQKRRAERKERRMKARHASIDNTPELEMEEKIEEEKVFQHEHMTTIEAYCQAYLYYLELAHPESPWILSHYNSFQSVEADELRRDITVARALSEEWEGIFELYDIVLAYSTDGILAMSGADVPYFTYEHGTLRSIPFENTTIGRLCATSYRLCNQLMVTNLDNLRKPTELGMEPKQVVNLPHAIDDRKLLGYRQLHRHLQPEQHDQPLFLCPARHDWGEEDPSLMKGNDKFLRAVKLLNDLGYRPRIILFDWGRHVEKSKRLISDLEIGELISWVKPMKKADLWKCYFTCHAIVDQFSIPAFGGVTFEGLTFGKRVITYIDKELSKEFFGEAPPLFNCANPDDIAVAMLKIINDPEDKLGVGRNAEEWARQYHSSQRILNLQLNAFKEVLMDSLRYDSDGNFLERKSPTRKISA